MKRLLKVTWHKGKYKVPPIPKHNPDPENLAMVAAKYRVSELCDQNCGRVRSHLCPLNRVPEKEDIVWLNLFTFEKCNMFIRKF